MNRTSSNRDPDLTADELEALAFRYGGTIERNVVTGELKLKVRIKGTPTTFRVMPVGAAS